MFVCTIRAQGNVTARERERGERPEGTESEAHTGGGGGGGAWCQLPPVSQSASQSVSPPLGREESKKSKRT